MERLGPGLFTHNWQQKLLAVFAALVVWLLVNNSITATKVLPNVAVRVVNLPPDKTIEGLLPNGLLRRHITLTLTGNKDVLEHLDASDIEIILDAANKGDEWIARIGRKNLATLNPEIDLLHNISTVSHYDFVIKLSKLVTAKIPVTIARPIGEPPKGYQFLDVWPELLFHTVSGAEQEVEELRNKGILLVFDLRKITASELDALKVNHTNSLNDEVVFPVPSRWKKVTIPFLGSEPQEINDPLASHLRIDFLRQELLPIDRKLPVRIFYPVKYDKEINPATLSLATNDLIKEDHGIKRLSVPLYAAHVSRLFLDVTRDNIEIALIPTNEQGTLHWSIQFVDSPELENEYVQRLLPIQESLSGSDHPLESEEYLRNRFRDYMQRFQLYKANDQPLSLQSSLQGNLVSLTDVTPQDAE